MMEEKAKLPSFDVPQEGYDLISEFMRIRDIKSRSEAVRVLLEESPVLEAIAGGSLKGKFSLGDWGGYRGRKTESS